MLISGKYGGIDLPFYGPEHYVAERQTFLWAAREAHRDDSYNPRFLRAARMYAPRLNFRTIAEVTENTDEHLERIAKLCGSTVIGHTWGIYKVPKNKAAHYERYALPFMQRRGLPRDHILVANVEALPPAFHRVDLLPPTDDTYKDVDLGIKAYYQYEGYRLGDLNQTAFMTADNKTVLVDIEPVWIRNFGNYHES